MADRANSLQHELAPLRELLVDWKKMEVRSWGELLNRVENDGRVRAQLVAFPLFDALFKAESRLLSFELRRTSSHCAKMEDGFSSGRPERPHRNGNRVGDERQSAGLCCAYSKRALPGGVGETSRPLLRLTSSAFHRGPL